MMIREFQREMGFPHWLEGINLYPGALYLERYHLDRIFTFSVHIFTHLKMSLTSKEFDINELKAGLEKPLHNGMTFVNVYYGNNHHRVPKLQVHGGMRVVKEKFRQFFELDLKDEETEEFFKLSVDRLKSLAGICLDEKPWNLKSPIIEYGPYYTVHCKIYSSSKLNDLKVGECF